VVDIMALLESRARVIDGLPEHLRGACRSDPYALWFQPRRIDQFSDADVRMLAERGFWLDVDPYKSPVFDLKAFADRLALFQGLRLSNEDARRCSGVEVIGELSGLRNLEVRFVIDDGLDLSGLVALERLGFNGRAVVSAFGLSRLTELGFGMSRIPHNARLTAPLDYLSFVVEDLSDLDFVASAQSLRTLEVEAPRFDLQWLDRFTQLKVVELGPVNQVVVPVSSHVLRREVSIKLDNVANVTGGENFALLPPGGHLNVQRNHAFPRDVQKLFARRGWYIAPYSAPSPRSVATAGDGEGVDYYPFILSVDDGQAELYFDNWDLLDQVVAAVAPDRTANEVVEAAMVNVAAELAISAENDSEAESARLRFEKRQDAEQVARRIRDLWFERDDQAEFLRRGLERPSDG